MKIILNIAIVCFTIILTGCTPERNPTGSVDESMIRVSYTESDEVFANPERGFYSAKDFRSAYAYPISKGVINVNKTNKRTLFYTGYYLTDYMESDIARDYLDLIKTNMQALRDGGMKCILRFAYKTDMYETGHPWDASPEWVARHITQLKPIFQEYSDVILCLQAGFVGVWGEWALTDHFVQSPNSVDDYALRKKVILDLLDALPEDRQIALRTPMFKRFMFLDSYTDTLTAETAHNGSDIARLCGHNDCFGATSNDMGTFVGKLTRDFWKSETRYVMMGGETCQLSNYCKCEQSQKDLEDYHWTYLNAGYNTSVLDRWKTDGCFEEVERRLGYRLSLAEAAYTRTPSAGSDFNIVLSIRNTGYAAPMNPRAVEFVLVDGKGKKTVYEQDDVDPRYWFAGDTVRVEKVITLPTDATGKCSVYLNLPDPKETLHDNPLFSIRLANDDIWDETTGYNKIAEFAL